MNRTRIKTADRKSKKGFGHTLAIAIGLAIIGAAIWCGASGCQSAEDGMATEGSLLPSASDFPADEGWREEHCPTCTMADQFRQQWAEKCTLESKESGPWTSEGAEAQCWHLAMTTVDWLPPGWSE